MCCIALLLFYVLFTSMQYCSVAVSLCCRSTFLLFCFLVALPFSFIAPLLHCFIAAVAGVLCCCLTEVVVGEDDGGRHCGGMGERLQEGVHVFIAQPAGRQPHLLLLTHNRVLERLWAEQKRTETESDK